MSDRTIHILMIGARRTGKSSVLASMINSFKAVARDTNFHLTADANTSSFIDDKLINLREEFDKHWGEETFTIDEMPTANPDDYVFTVSYRDKKKDREITTLEFHDIAGEDIDNKETAAQVKRAGVLLVAVDTVHLMEEEGRFSSVFHKSMQLKNIVATAGFADDEKDAEPKMVLFVPLKCEKYYEEHRIDDVVLRVEEEFRSLIEYLTKPNFRNRITVAITPILTMGSLAFDHFGRDEAGKVIRQKVQGKQDNMRPAKVYYKLIGDKMFRPQYCEQPVLYILSFVVASAKKAKETAKKKGNAVFKAIKFAAMFYLFGAIYLALWFLQRNKEFTAAYDKISINLKKNGDGYKILQNPLNM